MHNGILHKRFLSFSPHSALSGLAQRTRSSLCSFAPLCTAHLWMPLASLSHPLRNRPRRQLRRPTVEQLCNPSTERSLSTFGMEGNVGRMLASMEAASTKLPPSL